MDLPFVQLDVFTTKALGGNALAVFPDPQGISSEMMQAIARETNLSETTFIVDGPAARDPFNIRIFTPFEEVPFAGHPTVGTAWHLFQQHPELTQLTLDLKAGALPVCIERDEDLQFVYFKPPPIVMEEIYDNDEFIAELCGISPDDILHIAPVQMVSAGLRFLMVPVRNHEILEAARCDSGLLDIVGHRFGCKLLTVFCLPGYQSQSALAVRMFAPLHGVPEDPATGSNAACLAYYLREHDVLEDTGDKWMYIDQGYSIKRPSMICGRINRLGGQTRIEIGGNVVQIAEGFYRI